MSARALARVLLVEDNDARAAQITSWLEHERVRVVRARSGQAALWSVSNASFHLILLDHDLNEQHPLPGEQAVSGEAVARRLVASPRNRHARVIIHSMNASGRAEMRELLAANGFDVEVIPIADWTLELGRELCEDLVADLDD